MPKSRTNKSHKTRLIRYKLNKKREQEVEKKKMMDEYMKIQQEALANREAHTSTQEVSGPEVDIEELNKIEESQINIEELNQFEIPEINIEETNIENPDLL
jgi:hypothetical protein